MAAMNVATLSARERTRRMSWTTANGAGNLERAMLVLKGRTVTTPSVVEGCSVTAQTNTARGVGNEAVCAREGRGWRCRVPPNEFVFSRSLPEGVVGS